MARLIGTVIYLDSFVKPLHFLNCTIISKLYTRPDMNHLVNEHWEERRTLNLNELVEQVIVFKEEGPAESCSTRASIRGFTYDPKTQVLILEEFHLTQTEESKSLSLSPWCGREVPQTSTLHNRARRMCRVLIKWFYCKVRLEILCRTNSTSRNSFAIGPHRNGSCWGLIKAPQQVDVVCHLRIRRNRQEFHSTAH